jgi:hypothetical protein
MSVKEWGGYLKMLFNLKERKEIINELIIDKTDKRYLMSWCCQKVERLAMEIREVGLPKIKYQFYGNERYGMQII